MTAEEARPPAAATPPTVPPAVPPAVRPATAGDLDALAVLERRCFAEDPWSRRQIAEELEAAAGPVLVAESAVSAADPPEAPDTPPAKAAHPPHEPPSAPRLLAYAAFRRAAGEAELLRVAVDPSARRRGTALALVTAGLDRLRAGGAAACFLEVAAGNDAAIELYRRLGFHATGRRPRYYRSGDDALLMRLDLPSPPGITPPAVPPPAGGVTTE